MSESYPDLVELINRLKGKDRKTCELALYCLNKSDERTKLLWRTIDSLRAELQEADGMLFRQARRIRDYQGLNNALNDKKNDNK